MKTYKFKGWAKKEEYSMVEYGVIMVGETEMTIYRESSFDEYQQTSDIKMLPTVEFIKLRDMYLRRQKETG